MLSDAFDCIADRSRFDVHAVEECIIRNRSDVVHGRHCTQSAALCKRIGTDALDLIRNGDIRNALAVIEGIVSDRGNRLRKRDVRQHGHTVEGIIRNTGTACDLDLADCVIGKTLCVIVLHTRRVVVIVIVEQISDLALGCVCICCCCRIRRKSSIGQGQRLQLQAVAQRFRCNRLDARRNHQLCQKAAVKDIFVDFRNRFADHSFLHLIAVIERAFRNRGNAVHGRHCRQTLALSKGIGADLSHSIRNNDSGNALTIIEGIVADCCDRLRQLDISQHGHAVEGIARNAGTVADLDCSDRIRCKIGCVIVLHTRRVIVIVIEEQVSDLALRCIRAHLNRSLCGKGRIRQGQRFEQQAVVQRFRRNGLDRLRDHQLCENRILKHFGTDRRDRLADFRLCKTRAVEEGVIRDGCDIAHGRHCEQTGAVLEYGAAQLGHIVRNDDILQTRAEVECLGSKLCDALRQIDLIEHRHAVEGVVRDAGSVSDRDLADRVIGKIIRVIMLRTRRIVVVIIVEQVSDLALCGVGIDRLSEFRCGCRIRDSQRNERLAVAECIGADQSNRIRNVQICQCSIAEGICCDLLDVCGKGDLRKRGAAVEYIFRQDADASHRRRSNHRGAVCKGIAAQLRDGIRHRDAAQAPAVIERIAVDLLNRVRHLNA